MPHQGDSSEEVEVDLLPLEELKIMQIFTPSVKDGPGRLGLDVSPCPGIAVLSCMMQLLRMELDTTKE